MYRRDRSNDLTKASKANLDFFENKFRNVHHFAICQSITDIYPVDNSSNILVCPVNGTIQCQIRETKRVNLDRDKQQQLRDWKPKTTSKRLENSLSEC